MTGFLVVSLPMVLMLAIMLINLWIREPWEERREQRRRQAALPEHNEEKLAVKP